MKNIAIAIFINILLYGAANAQPLTTIPYQAHLSKAQEYADEGNYASQIEELEEAYKQKRDRSFRSWRIFISASGIMPKLRIIIGE